MKIEDINLDNAIQSPFNYILIENFAPMIQDQSVYDEYLQNYDVTNAYPELSSVSGHPIEEQLQQNKLPIIKNVNKLWNLNVSDIYISTSTFNKKGHGLRPHNDFHEVDRIPVRGILYCNPIKKFGTNIHTSDNSDPLKEIGGNPGDLLLIKVAENSWHSTVMVEENCEDRITCNMFFVNEINPDTNFSVNEGLANHMKEMV
tara:strand:- start:45 stop:650 length:606 start_codon:yes stop_codon:yes gene_type:complete